MNYQASLDRAIEQIVGQIHNPEPGTSGPERVFTDDGEYEVKYELNMTLDGVVEVAVIEFWGAELVVKTLHGYQRGGLAA